MGAPLTPVRVPWWPVQFVLDFDDAPGRRWAEHHWHQCGVPPVDPECRVEIASRQDPAAVALARASVAAGRHLGFVAAFEDPRYFARLSLDGQPTLLGRPRSSAGAFVLRRDGTEPERWSVLADGPPGGSPPGKRLAAEILRRELTGRRHIQLHGAAVVSDDGAGVVLVGGSGAGKTTAAVVLGARARLCSGDRISVLVGPDDVRMVAYPDAVRLGFGTARELGVIDLLLGNPLLRSQDFRRPDGSLDDDCWRPGSRRKISLTRLEVTQLLRTQVAAHGPVTDVVLLRRDRLRRRPRIVRVAPDEIHAEVAAQDMTLRSAYRPWLTDPGTGQRPANVEPLGLLLRRVRSWRVDWDPSVAAAGTIADVLLSHASQRTGRR